MNYSVIIPLYNEEESLRELHRQLTSVCAPMGSYELLFVNDGSTDGSAQVIRDLVKTDEHASLIQLRKNFGKSIALAAGFAQAKGDIIVMIDADLQDEPEEIPKLVAALDSADMVVGWKQQRNDPWTKTFPSHIFNGMARKMFQLQLHDLNCGLKVMRHEVAKELQLYGELHRFLPVLAVQKGFTVSERPVQHHERKFGQSKYGWRRFGRGMFDLLTVGFLARFRSKPMHLFGGIGLVSILLGLLLSVVLSVEHFHGRSIGDRPLLLLAVLLIVTGLQCFFTGLLAELLNERTQHQDLPIRSVTRHGDATERS